MTIDYDYGRKSYKLLWKLELLNPCIIDLTALTRERSKKEDMKGFRLRATTTKWKQKCFCVYSYVLEVSHSISIVLKFLF